MADKIEWLKEGETKRVTFQKRKRKRTGVRHHSDAQQTSTNLEPNECQVLQDESDDNHDIDDISIDIVPRIADDFTNTEPSTLLNEV